MQVGSRIVDFFLVKVQSKKKGARIVEICEQRKGGGTKHMAHKTLVTNSCCDSESQFIKIELAYKFFYSEEKKGGREPSETIQKSDKRRFRRK